MIRNFWEPDEKLSENILLIDPANDNIQLTYGEAFRISDSISKAFTPGKKLAFLFCRNDYKSILCYLALLRSGNAVLLLDSKLNDEIRNNLIEIYRPGIVFFSGKSTFGNYHRVNIDNEFFYYASREENPVNIYKDLGVLLSTSGTTGSPKLVRLSYRNIQSNAESIAEYLDITSEKRAVTSLPMSYSYGLSVINSYILSGASLLMTDKSFVFKDFWDSFNHYKCTSFAGVPYSYELLKKTNFENTELPTLETMTQAGGRLSAEMITYFDELLKSKGKKFFVMYGQTEATARISYVPPSMLPEKTGSIGIPIPGGTIRLFSEGDEVKENGIEGELLYEGENVMLGYAEDKEDLGKGDELKGILHTGDLAYRDEDGFYYIAGRLKRFIKIFGLRINLDEVEKMIESHYGVFNACSGIDDRLNILIETNDSETTDDIRQKVSQYYKIKKSVVTVRLAEKMPVTESGKKDYSAISRLF
jgi:long-chain acyl-CoA synthetase